MQRTVGYAAFDEPADPAAVRANTVAPQGRRLTRGLPVILIAAATGMLGWQVPVSLLWR